MANMNKENYWKLRKRINSVLFKIKAWLYKIIGKLETFKEYHSFRGMVIRNILSGVIKTILLVVAIFSLDVLAVKVCQYFRFAGLPDINSEVFIDVVIGSIGVAGVILGLYCANISSIFSSRYANAPEKITIAFQNDRITRKCMSSIVSFIIYGFATIIEALLDIKISWFTVLAIAFWTIYVLISYSIAGNRVYQLSDIYRLADDSFRALYKIIKKVSKQNLFTNDISFQNHYYKEAEKYISLLQMIQKFGTNKNYGDSTHTDNTTMVEFVCKNLLLIEEYWKNKNIIDKTSLWFRNEEKYQKWHLSNDTEIEIALHTGTGLLTKKEHNYWWLENEIMSISCSCFEIMLKEHKFESFYSCLSALDSLCATAVFGKEVDYYANQINGIKNLLERYMVSESDDNDTKKAFAGVVEKISLLYLGLILESTKFYSKFNIENIAEKVVKAVNSGHITGKSPLPSGSFNRDFYEKVLTEICVEGHRITPTWVIKQGVAKEEFDYLNELVKIIYDGIEQNFSFGKELIEKELWLESCILISKFYEFESKLNHFINIVTIQENEIRKLQIDKELKWADFQIKSLKETYEKWKNEIPELLLKCSSKFALATWKNREDYPDFLGETFNHICEDAVDSIIKENLTQFKQDYINLSKLMLLYSEYIRTDFLKEKDKYRIEYAYYMFTSPIVEWAQIGGLAILWGEFGSDNSWNKIVDDEAKQLLNQNNKDTNLAETIIQYIQNRDTFMLGFGSRGILETNWSMRVANAIRDTKKCEVEYENYGAHLKTSSILLRAFCGNFIDMGFISDVSEVFWVKCVNPLLPNEKQFRSKSSWEDKLDV